jgi:hypothetical protein
MTATFLSHAQARPSLHFATTLLAISLFVQGPMRVPFLRCRSRGGRIL